MIRVLEILPGGSVIVSTEGLFRVIIKTDDDEILAELVDEKEAAAIVKVFRDVWPEKELGVIGYDALLPQNTPS